MARTSGGASSAAVASAIATRKLTASVRGSKLAGASACCSPDSAARTGGHSACDFGVGFMPLAVRTNSVSPIASCSRFNAWLAAGCVIDSTLAARVRLPSAITASNTRSRLRSIVRKFTIGLRCDISNVYIPDAHSSGWKLSIYPNLSSVPKRSACRQEGTQMTTVTVNVASRSRRRRGERHGPLRRRPRCCGRSPTGPRRGRTRARRSSRRRKCARWRART